MNNVVIKLCQKSITKLQASYILYTYSAFTTYRQSSIGDEGMGPDADSV